MRKTLLSLLLLLSLSVEGQIRVLSQASADAFFPANDARYVNVSGDTMTGALALPVGSNAATTLNFGTAGTGLFSAATASDLSVAVGGSRRFAFQAASFLPIGAGYNLGGSSNGWGAFYLAATVAPAAPSAGAVIYIDTADSDLKIKYSDGTVVVIGNKP